MIIKLKKGDSYIEVDTELNYDEVDTVMNSDKVTDEEDFKVEDRLDDEQ